VLDVSEDDLRVIAEHGYEGAASADRVCRSHLFISDTVAGEVTYLVPTFKEACFMRAPNSRVG
jgi:hypothetical protein